MLTLFILKSGQPEADSKKAKASFGSVVSEVIEVNSLGDIDPSKMKNSWYGICYDNERADEGLEASLKIFLKHSDADVLILYSKHDNGTKSKAPRLFRQSVRIRSDSLMPEHEYALKFDAILNGWII